MAFADAGRRGSVLAYVLACVFRSRHALWTGPIGEAMHDARAALELSPPHSVYLCSAAYCLVSGLLEQARARTRPRPCSATSTSTSRLRRRSSRPGARWPAGGSPPRRGEHAAAIDAYLAAGRHHTALGHREPRRPAVAIRGRAGRPATRPRSTAPEPWSTRSSPSPSASAARARSGSPGARPACSPAAKRPSSCFARPPSCSPAAAPASSTPAP